VNVIEKADRLKDMLKASKGSRKVPVIVDGDKVTVGFGGS
jgi:glutaredoxin